MKLKNLSGFIVSLLLLNAVQARDVTLYWTDLSPGITAGFIARSSIVGSGVTNRIDYGTTPPLEVVFQNQLLGAYYQYSVEATNAAGSAVSTNLFASVPAPVQNLTKPTPTSLRWQDTNSAPDLVTYSVYSGSGFTTNQTTLTFSQVTRTGVNGNRTVTYTNFLAVAEWVFVTTKNQAGLESDVSQLVLLPKAPVGLGVR